MRGGEQLNQLTWSSGTEEGTEIILYKTKILPVQIGRVHPRKEGGEGLGETVAVAVAVAVDSFPAFNGHIHH